MVTDSSSDSPLLRSSRSSRPRTVYFDKVTIASLTSLNPRTNYLVKTKPRLLLTFLNIKYFITFHFSPHLHKNGNRFYFRREALRGRGDSAELSAWAKASTGVAHLHQPAPVHCTAPSSCLILHLLQPACIILCPRLAGQDDGPDGEIPLEQQSFLHSKCKQVTIPSHFFLKAN